LPCVQHISTKGLFGNRQARFWLPAAYAVRGPDPDGTTFYQRIAAKAIRDAQLLTHLPDGEPFAAFTMHRGVQPGTSKEVINLDSMIKRSAPTPFAHDALRGRPRHVTYVEDPHRPLLRQLAHSFVDYATPRLHHLQTLSQLTTVRAPSSSAAACKLVSHRHQAVTENYEALQPHRAVRNVMTLSSGSVTSSTAS